MAATVTPYAAALPNNQDSTLQEFIYDGLITLTANYGGAATHGDALSLSPLVMQSNQLPNMVEIWEAPAAGTAPTGYIFGFAPGTTQNNGVLTVMGGTTEYTQASAYAAGLLAAVLRIRIWVPKFI